MVLDKNSVKYAITINYDNSKQFFNMPNRHKLCTEYCSSNLAALFKPYASYMVYPEISDSGRWHYHGIIEFFDVATFLLDKAHRIGMRGYPCNIDFTVIKDMPGWIEYIFKQEAAMNTFISKRLSYQINENTNYHYTFKVPSEAPKV